MTKMLEKKKCVRKCSSDVGQTSAEFIQALWHHYIYIELRVRMLWPKGHRRQVKCRLPHIIIIYRTFNRLPILNKYMKFPSDSVGNWMLVSREQWYRSYKTQVHPVINSPMRMRVYLFAVSCRCHASGVTNFP